MSEQDNFAKLVGAIDDLWAGGEREEAIAAARNLITAYPDRSEAHEKLALLRIHHAADNPLEDQLAPALDSLNRALELDETNLAAREVRGNLLFIIAHQLNDPIFFQRALKDFLELERIGGSLAPTEAINRWRLEAARSAFLTARNSPPESADYKLAAELFGRVDPESLEAGDWFFRGLAAREFAERSEDQSAYREAAQSFLRAVEEGGFDTEGRYFAADSLLALGDISDGEFQQAENLVQELASLPRQDFLMDVLRQRLDLRRKLLEGNAEQ